MCESKDRRAAPLTHLRMFILSCVCYRLFARRLPGLPYGFTCYFSTARSLEPPCLQHLVDGEVVDEGTDNTPSARGDNRNPEVVIVLGQAGAAADNGNPEARTKIQRRVDGVSGVQAEGHPNGYDQEADNQGIQVCLDRLVAYIHKSKD